MKRSEFTNLIVNDICYLKRGRDTGIKCLVVYIENDWILIRREDGKTFNEKDKNKPLKLVNWKELDTKQI